MAKAEIGFERTLEDGTKRDVYVAHNGGQYRFFAREKRFDQWGPVKEPPIEDWLEFLDCVRRRIARRKLMPDEESRVIQAIRERFPGQEI
jgi:hypothetical protein